MTKQDCWLSVNEMCKYLGVSKETIYAWIGKNKMPAKRIGRLWRLEKNEVNEWIKSRNASKHLNKGLEPKTSNRKYCMSFTTGSLFYQESLKLTSLYFQLNDWSAVQDKVLTENLLQAKTLNTSKRHCREIISRLKTISPIGLNLLVHGNFKEQLHLLWLAVCRQYKFIADFAVEILREHYITLKTNLHPLDFDFFFNKKSEWYPELDQIKSTTRNKLRQVLFKMLREADLLTKNNIINGAMLSPRLLETIPHENAQDILYFPVFESDLKRIIK